jgi:hypothetical protein
MEKAKKRGFISFKYLRTLKMAFWKLPVLIIRPDYR